MQDGKLSRAPRQKRDEKIRSVDGDWYELEETHLLAGQRADERKGQSHIGVVGQDALLYLLGTWGRGVGTTRKSRTT